MPGYPINKGTFVRGKGVSRHSGKRVDGKVGKVTRVQDWAGTMLYHVTWSDGEDDVLYYDNLERNT